MLVFTYQKHGLKTGGLLKLTVQLKKCTRCKRTKKQHLFAKDRSNKDGLNDNCKSCIKKYKSQRRKKQEIEDFEKWKANQLRSNWMSRSKKYNVDPKEIPSISSIKEWLLSKKPYVCEYTGKELGQDFTVDHKKAVSDEGRWGLDNLAIVDFKINGTKGNLSDQEFRQLLELTNTWPDKGERLFNRLQIANGFFRRRR